MNEAQRLVRDAQIRYQTDAEFHAEVYRAVLVAMQGTVFNDYQEQAFVRNVASDAVAVALELRDWKDLSL